MYKNLSLIFKQAKNKRGANFFTKLSKDSKDSLKVKLEQILQISTKKNFISQSVKSFASGEHRFEKLPERSTSSGNSGRAGKLNLRATLMAEPLHAILTFLNENGNNMNDGDYVDAIFLIGTKLEGDTFGRINIMNVEKQISFQNIKKHILNNFDKLSTEPYSSQTLLLLMAQLNIRNRVRSLFVQDQVNKVVASNLANLETHFSKMTLLTILNVITLCGMFRGFNPTPYLKEKYEEAGSLGFMNMYRLLRRVSSTRESEIIREIVSRFLIKDFLNMAASEKMGNKSKAFSIVSKLDSMLPFSSNHMKLITLLKDIRSQPENHDQQSILNMIEGLIYFDDFTRGETLKEFYDIVTMTIKHQPENVKVDFVLRFLEHVSKYKNDNALTHEHLKILLDYVTTTIQTSAESGQRVPNSSLIVPVFTVMKKHKFFDKEITESLFKTIETYITKIQLNEHLKSLKFMVGKVLDEQYTNKLENEVPGILQKEFEMISEGPLGRVMNVFNKAVFFAPKSTVTSEINTAFLAKIDSVFKDADINLVLNFTNDYVSRVQQQLPIQFKVAISEKILNKLNAEDLVNSKNPSKAISIISEIVTTKERDDLRTKQNELIKSLCEDPRINRQIVNYFQRIAKDEESTISNATIYKFLNIIKEFSKKDEFLKENEKILEKLLNTAFSFLFNMERDSNITHDAISQILSYVDFTHKNHPELTVEVNSNRAIAYLKAFNQSHMSSSALNFGLLEYLRRSRDPERNFISNDTITVIEKLLRSFDVNQDELKELVKKFIPSEEKAEELFNTMNTAQKIGLFKLFSNLNKKRYDEVPDNLMKKFKTYMFDNVIKMEDTSDGLKLQALFSMNNLRGNILNYEEDTKEINSVIKTVFSSSTTKKIFRQIENLPVNNLFRYGRRLVSEFSQIYEKDANIDRFFLLKILDRFTLLKYVQPSFYNKILTDLEKNYEALSPFDHNEIINFFSRVEFNKEDVIKASAKNLNLKNMSDVDKFTLFNSLVKLGFTNQEWREIVLDRLVKETDFSVALQKANTKERFQGMINLWKLEDYPSNHAELVDTFVSAINKHTKLKITDKNIRSNLNSSEDWLYIVRRSPYFTKFDSELQANIDTLFKAKVKNDMNGYLNKSLAEYLKAMGHNIEAQPSDKICDFYLPESKMALIIKKKNLMSIISGDALNQTGVFIENTLKKAGLTPVIISQQDLGNILDKDTADVISVLESLGVKNIVEGKSDFSEVDSLKRVSAERKLKRAQEASATVESDEE